MKADNLPIAVPVAAISNWLGRKLLHQSGETGTTEGKRPERKTYK